MAKEIRIRAASSVGGQPIVVTEGIRWPKKKSTYSTIIPLYLIGTPGRIADHLRRGNIAPKGIFIKGKLAREDVGQVEVLDYYAFVAVRSNKIKQLLSLISGSKIKGMKALIEQAR